MSKWFRAYTAVSIVLMAAIMFSHAGIVVTVAGVLTGILATAAVVAGIRMHRPDRPRIWWLLVLGMVCTSLPKDAGAALTANGPTVAISVVGNVCFIIAPLLFVRACGGNDRDESIDGWMLTLALAVGLRQFLLAGQPDRAVVPQQIVLVLTIMTGVAVAASIRLAFLAGRCTSVWLFLLGSIAGQLIGVSLAMVNSGITATAGGADTLAGLGRLLIGAAALTPSMTGLTRRASRQSTIPHARMILLAVALPISIIGVFVEAGGKVALSFAGIGVFTIVVLLIVRMVGLLNERERARGLQELVAELGTQALADADEEGFLAHVCQRASEVLRAELTAELSAASPLTAASADGEHDTAAGPIQAESGELRLPLAGDGQLVLRRSEKAKPFTDNERLCAEAISITVSNALRRYRSEAQVRHASLHDILTGLPNRALFLREVGLAITASPPGQVSILFIDLDRFKSVNDKLGHQAGDELLVSVADRIRPLLSADFLLARLAGDEFAVLHRGTEPGVNPAEIAMLIADRLAEPFLLSAGLAEIGGSVGVATHDAVESIEHLMNRADTAMYARKQTPVRQ